ncbi:MAG TPA: hypothetical protein VGC87_04700 [Pyrinomonadaceae bacterium]|jgi:hypothetical protein
MTALLSKNYKEKIRHQIKFVGDMAVSANAIKDHKAFIDANTYMVETEAELREVEKALKDTEG